MNRNEERIKAINYLRERSPSGLLLFIVEDICPKSRCGKA
jgi:hypothetical protein